MRWPRGAGGEHGRERRLRRTRSSGDLELPARPRRAAARASARGARPLPRLPGCRGGAGEVQAARGDLRGAARAAAPRRRPAAAARARDRARRGRAGRRAARRGARRDFALRAAPSSGCTPRPASTATPSSPCSRPTTARRARGVARRGARGRPRRACAPRTRSAGRSRAPAGPGRGCAWRARALPLGSRDPLPRLTPGWRRGRRVSRTARALARAGARRAGPGSAPGRRRRRTGRWSASAPLPTTRRSGPLSPPRGTGVDPPYRRNRPCKPASFQRSGRRGQGVRPPVPLAVIREAGACEYGSSGAGGAQPEEGSRMPVPHRAPALAAPTLHAALGALRARGIRVSAPRRRLLECLYAPGRRRARPSSSRPPAQATWPRSTATSRRWSRPASSATPTAPAAPPAGRPRAPSARRPNASAAAGASPSTAPPSPSCAPSPAARSASRSTSTTSRSPACAPHARARARRAVVGPMTPGRRDRSRPSVRAMPSASEQIIAEVTSWPGITAVDGTRGEGLSFRARQAGDRPPPRRPCRPLRLPARGRRRGAPRRRAHRAAPRVPGSPQSSRPAGSRRPPTCRT